MQDKPAEIDPVALMQYLLFAAVPAPLGIYAGDHKMRPGSYLLWKGGQVAERNYWDMAYPESEDQTEELWSPRVRNEIRAAVHRNLDGCQVETTGAYLSGGTDSSSVVGLASERLSRVNAFSIFFAEERYSEIGYARIAANHFQAKHYERQLNPQDAVTTISKISAYYDEPFSNSSAIATFCCADMARQAGIRIMLAGDGGDEVFAGNERYASDRKFSVYQRMPIWLRRGVVEPLTSLLPEQGPALSLPRRYVQRASIPNPRRIFSYGLFFSTKPEEVFEPDFLAEVPADSWMTIADGHYNRHSDATELNRLMYFDLKMILADNDLRKVVGTAELAGVRVRFPFLDHRLVEFTGRIPSSLKMRGSQKRYIFKSAMRGILPEEVLAKKKHGFGVPLGLWLLRDRSLNTLMRDLLDDPRARHRGIIRRKFLANLLERQDGPEAPFFGETLWSILALELWGRQQLQALPASAYVS